MRSLAFALSRVRPVGWYDQNKAIARSGFP